MGQYGLPRLHRRGHRLFPVFVPGALFFLGDGHALQGDGEVIGTGIETTFEVEFTVDLIKGKKACLAAWGK